MSTRCSDISPYSLSTASVTLAGTFLVFSSPGHAETSENASCQSSVSVSSVDDGSTGRSSP